MSYLHVLYVVLRDSLFPGWNIFIFFLHSAYPVWGLSPGGSIWPVSTYLGFAKCRQPVVILWSSNSAQNWSYRILPSRYNSLGGIQILVLSKCKRKKKKKKNTSPKKKKKFSWTSVTRIDQSESSSPVSKTRSRSVHFGMLQSSSLCLWRNQL